MKKFPFNVRKHFQGTICVQRHQNKSCATHSSANGPRYSYFIKLPRLMRGDIFQTKTQIRFRRMKTISWNFFKLEWILENPRVSCVCLHFCPICSIDRAKCTKVRGYEVYATTPGDLRTIQNIHTRKEETFIPEVYYAPHVRSKPHLSSTVRLWKTKRVRTTRLKREHHHKSKNKGLLPDTFGLE